MIRSRPPTFASCAVYLVNTSNAALTNAVRAYPQYVRRWGENVVLTEWADAFLNGNDDIARKKLELAREIGERLQNCADLRLVTLHDRNRKDAAARQAALNEANIVILCLPDAAAREAVSLLQNPATRVIDASTAHRVAQGWTYGFPEMEKPRRAELHAARRVSKCSSAGSSQTTSRWLVSGDTSTIVIGPSPTCEYAIAAPSSARA